MSSDKKLAIKDDLYKITKDQLAAELPGDYRFVVEIGGQLYAVGPDEKSMRYFLTKLQKVYPSGKIYDHKGKKQQ